jgi:hypothetical protein
MIRDYVQSIPCFPLFAIAIDHSAFPVAIAIGRMQFDQLPDLKASRIKPTFAMGPGFRNLHLFALCFAGVEQPHMCRYVPTTCLNSITGFGRDYTKIQPVFPSGVRALGTPRRLGPVAHGRWGTRERSGKQNRAFARASASSGIRAGAWVESEVAIPKYEQCECTARISRVSLAPETLASLIRSERGSSD